MLPDDDAFPLFEQLVGPQDFVDAVLRESEEQIHYREREENARVDEDSAHRSVGQVCVGCSVGCSTSAVAATVALLRERENVGEQDAAVATAGQPLRRDRALIEQPSHERTREPQEFACLGGSEYRVGAQDRDGVAFSEFTGGGANDIEERRWQWQLATVGERKNHTLDGVVAHGLRHVADRARLIGAWLHMDCLLQHTGPRHGHLHIRNNCNLQSCPGPLLEEAANVGRIDLTEVAGSKFCDRGFELGSDSTVLESIKNEPHLALVALQLTKVRHRSESLAQ